MRKAATLEKVTSITDLAGSNTLEVLTFSDSTFVSKKGRFKIGEFVVVIRAGSKIPPALAKSTNTMRYYDDLKVKKLVLRGAVSNCMVFNVASVLPTTSPYAKDPERYLGLEIGHLIGVYMPYKQDLSNPLPRGLELRDNPFIGIDALILGGVIGVLVTFLLYYIATHP